MEDKDGWVGGGAAASCWRVVRRQERVVSQDGESSGSDQPSLFLSGDLGQSALRCAYRMNHL